MLSSIEEFTSRSQSDIRHKRPSNQNLSESEKPTAEIKSISYIEDFWPYLCDVIYEDPEQLGLTVKLNINSEERLLKAEDLKTAFIQDKSDWRGIFQSKTWFHTILYRLDGKKYRPSQRKVGSFHEVKSQIHVTLHFKT